MNDKIFDTIEMECHCEHCSCKNPTNYHHKDDWNNPEDWACSECLEKCYKDTSH